MWSAVKSGQERQRGRIAGFPGSATLTISSQQLAAAPGDWELNSLIGGARTLCSARLAWLREECVPRALIPCLQLMCPCCLGECPQLNSCAQINSFNVSWKKKRVHFWVDAGYRSPEFLALWRRLEVGGREHTSLSAPWKLHAGCPKGRTLVQILASFIPFDHWEVLPTSYFHQDDLQMNICLFSKLLFWSANYLVTGWVLRI